MKRTAFAVAVAAALGIVTFHAQPDFTCFQAGSEIAAGAKAELGSLYNTQPKPEVGPWAAAK